MKKFGSSFLCLYFCTPFRIELWCNGSTTDFGSVCLGSNPSSSTAKTGLLTNRFFYALFLKSFFPDA
jgi:hypothetical protein